MEGIDENLLKVSRSTLELSQRGEASIESEDGNHNIVIAQAAGSYLLEMSQVGWWGHRAEMPETAGCKVRMQVEEKFKHQPCNEVFPDVNSSDQILRCNFCDQAFFFHDLKGLQQHILEHHYQCSKCGLCEEVFASKDALKHHIRQRHLNETFSCDVCHMECQDLTFHMETFHKSEAAPKKLPRQKGRGVKQTCPQCKKEISVDNFYRHVQEKHSKLRSTCPHCHKNYAPSNLKRHIRQVHNGEKARCPECEKLMTACNLNKHVKTVHMKVKTICQICDMEIPLSRISHHRRVVHNIGRPKEVVIPRTLKLKKTKSLLKMAQPAEAEEDRTSTQMQGQVLVKAEENVEGDSVQVVKEEFFLEDGGRKHLDINGNNSNLEEGTGNGYQHDLGC